MDMGDNSAPTSTATAQLHAPLTESVEAVVQPKDWSELQVDLIGRIINDYLPSRLDRFFLSCVNTHWFQNMRMLNLLYQPVLPLLFLPSRTTPTFFDPVANRVRKVHRLPDDVKLGYPLGSYSGGWLVVENCENEQKHIMFNFLSRQSHHLPATIIDQNGDVAVGHLLMIAFSGTPLDPGCQTVGVFTYMNSLEQVVALWKEGQLHWVEIGFVSTCWEDEDDGQGEREVVDIRFHQGLFYLLTPDEHIITVNPEQGSLGMTGHAVCQREDIDAEDLYLEQNNAHVLKYLTESAEGSLLMGIKYMEPVTENIRIYTPRVNEATGKQTWTEYMGGDTMYLGRCCSRSYYTDGERVIHFLDDTENRLIDGRFDRSDMGGFVPDGHLFKYRTPVLPPTEPAFVRDSDASPPIWCSVPLIDLRP